MTEDYRNERDGFQILYFGTHILISLLDKDSVKMRRCGEGCHKAFGEDIGALFLWLCVQSGTDETS